MNGEPIIQLEHLTKVYRNYDRRVGIVGAVKDLFARRYRVVNAVSDVSFSIDRGEMVGYIGANGAGKSTTIKMLTGILTPTSGRMHVGGLEPQKNRYAHAKQIGVVFGQRTQLWWDLAVIEAFNLLQKIYQIPLDAYRARLELFIDVLDIREQLHQPVRKLSLGQRMKCDLAASLLHGPAILFLDEPTIGLDVAVKERIRRFIRYINQQYQSTVLLTTHDLTDIEELCPRIIIIDQGRILFDGPTEEIKRRFGHARRVVLEFKRDYLPQFSELPQPSRDLPLTFLRGSAETLREADAARFQGDNGQSEVGAADAAVEAVVGEAAATELDSGQQAVNGGGLLDEPGARQFMAALSAVMGGGAVLPVQRLNLRQYQVTFDRRQYTARQVIGRLLDDFEVEDLELHEPELADIVRAIYEGVFQVGPESGPAALSQSP